MKKYVLGFAFNVDLTHVLLIMKNKPAEQKNRLNGIGGKIEEYDASPLDTMVREFDEETSAPRTEPSQWMPFINMINHKTDGRWPDAWDVACFATILPNDVFFETKQREAEVVVITPLDKIPEAILPNVRWLIPMAKNALLYKETFHTIEWA